MNTLSSRDQDRAGLTADRRAFMTGLGVAAVSVVFAPVQGLAAPAMAVAPTAQPVTAVFWGLAYNDFTGLVAPYARPRRTALASAFRDADPHAELLGRA
jgi:hypothetical protein